MGFINRNDTHAGAGELGDLEMLSFPWTQGEGNIENHFFEFKGLDLKGNYGQVYIRTNDIVNFIRNYWKTKLPTSLDGHSLHFAKT